MPVFMYITRNLEATILRHLESPEILAVVGPRQAGKTSLISHVFAGLQHAVSISFEDRRILSLFENNIDDFITAYVKGNRYVFIDEFQYARHGGKGLKYIYDTQKTKIVISGSSAIDLTVRAVKYLVGRVLVFSLYPFDFHEYLSAVDEPACKLFCAYQKKTDLLHANIPGIPKDAHALFSRHYSQYILFGGYPRVVLEQDSDAKKELLRNIYNTYFLREVRDILGLIDDYKLSMLLNGLALQIGNLIEYQELSRMTGYSFAAVKKYMNFFEKTYICNLVRPFYTNKRTEIVKNPKVYFFDTGLRNSIVNDFRTLDHRPDAGALLENGIAMQAIKKNYPVRYWRDKKKHEVDFVFSLGEGNTIAIESKLRARRQDVKELIYIQRMYPQFPALISSLGADRVMGESNSLFPVFLF